MSVLACLLFSQEDWRVLTVSRLARPMQTKDKIRFIIPA